MLGTCDDVFVLLRASREKATTSPRRSRRDARRSARRSTGDARVSSASQSTNKTAGYTCWRRRGARGERRSPTTWRFATLLPLPGNVADARVSPRALLSWPREPSWMKRGARAHEVAAVRQRSDTCEPLMLELQAIAPRHHDARGKQNLELQRWPLRRAVRIDAPRVSCRPRRPHCHAFQDGDCVRAPGPRRRRGARHGLVDPGASWPLVASQRQTGPHFSNLLYHPWLPEPRRRAPFRACKD